jgi:hypothetical protein
MLKPSASPYFWRPAGPDWRILAGSFICGHSQGIVRVSKLLAERMLRLGGAITCWLKNFP